VSGEQEQELIAALERDFEGWHVWKGVGDTGWYAKRPRSSPPAVVGPYPLEALRDEVAQREAAHKRWELGR